MDFSFNWMLTFSSEKTGLGPCSIFLLGTGTCSETVPFVDKEVISQDIALIQIARVRKTVGEQKKKRRAKKKLIKSRK